MARAAEEEIVLLLLLIKLVKVASGALVNVAAGAVKHIVRLGHALKAFVR